MKEESPLVGRGFPVPARESLATSSSLEALARKCFESVLQCSREDFMPLAVRVLIEEAHPEVFLVASLEIRQALYDHEPALLRGVRHEVVYSRVVMVSVGEIL